jgi:hypothetical protein
VVSACRVGVNLNGESEIFFSIFKELRWDDPLSLLLFNLVVDGLAANKS